MKKHQEVIGGIILGLVGIILVAFLIMQAQENSVNINLEVEEVTPLAYALYESKNPYIGDVSANQQLLTLLDISDKFGVYQIELETDKAPYVLKLSFQDKVDNRELLDLDLQDQAYLLLALIQNLEEVQWYYTTEEEGEAVGITHYVTEKQATEILHVDIKKFSDSPERVQALLDRLEINE